MKVHEAKQHLQREAPRLVLCERCLPRVDDLIEIPIAKLHHKVEISTAGGVQIRNPQQIRVLEMPHQLHLPQSPPQDQKIIVDTGHTLHCNICAVLSISK
jgi:hypothetical protein